MILHGDSSSLKHLPLKILSAKIPLSIGNNDRYPHHAIKHFKILRYG